jgi:hypothetical protein
MSNLRSGAAVVVVAAAPAAAEQCSSWVLQSTWLFVWMRRRRSGREAEDEKMREVEVCVGTVARS